MMGGESSAVEQGNQGGHAAGRLVAAQERRRVENEKLIKSLVTVCKRSLSRGEFLSRAEVARRAGVSRSFVYQNARARRIIAEFNSHFSDKPYPAEARPMIEVRKWKTRALNAERQARRLRDERSRLSAELSANLGDARAMDQALGGRDVLDVLGELQELRQRATQVDRENEKLRCELAANRRLIAGMVGPEAD
ncbi:hypothetical protein IUU84_00835 [Kocuria rhizophila]|uniref:DUF6262 family protein n=1 Tax=Kocuria rhizophila TaxID=72000 RepID=UPI002948F5E4|nr:DUF6262 family protein [Kocuria rhizophila]MDV5998144.1 hypothetical protein [Kocuria rhizophila]